MLLLFDADKNSIFHKILKFMVIIMKLFECLFDYFHHIKKLLLMNIIETELVVWK